MWTPEKAAEYMKKLAGRITDKETFFLNAEEVHMEMDNFLCSLLRQLGYKDVVEVFKNTPKWHA